MMAVKRSAKLAQQATSSQGFLLGTRGTKPIILRALEALAGTRKCVSR